MPPTECRKGANTYPAKHGEVVIRNNPLVDLGGGDGRLVSGSAKPEVRI
jgi:hypothetical protein